MPDRAAAERQVFVNPAGQRDNIGDSVLRRPYLDALRSRGTLHVLVGNHEDYTTGLRLETADVRYTSKTRWLAAALAAGVKNRLDFAANAGEYEGTWKSYVSGAWQPMIAIAARATGGAVFLCGASLRVGGRARLTHLGLLSRLAAQPTWREPRTQQLFGRGDVQPDWAFATFNGHEAGVRNVLAVTFRSDRPYPDGQWLHALRDLAESKNLDIIVPVQVRRDQERASKLADDLGGEIVPWPAGRNHASQERIVREIYSRSIAVVSDRIHALILGATQGAQPVAMSSTSYEKIEQTFAAVGGWVPQRHTSFVRDPETGDHETLSFMERARSALDARAFQIGESARVNSGH